MRLQILSAIFCCSLNLQLILASDIATAFSRAAVYTSGQDRSPLRELELAAAASVNNQALRTSLETGLIQLLVEPSGYETRKLACELLAAIGSANAVPALAALLADPAHAEIACFALQPNPSTQADQALRAALPSADGAIRLQIIHTLGERRDPQSVPDLVQLARSTDHHTTEAAIAALGKIGDDPAQTALRQLQSEANPSLAPAFAEAFLRIAERRVTEANLAGARSLYESLLGLGHSAAVRRGALIALLALDSDGGARRIQTLIRQPDPALLPTAIAAIEGLVGTDVSRSFALELPNLQPQLRALMVEALAGRADPDARAAIIQRLADTDPTVRLAAISAASRVGDAAVVPPLASALGNASSTDVIAEIQRALIQLPREPEVDKAILTQLSTAPDTAKPVLIAALGQRRSRVAWPQILMEAGQPQNAVARAAWQALARMATADDLPEMLERLNDMAADAARPEAETAVNRALLLIDDRSSRAAQLFAAQSQATTVESRCSLLRLLPRSGDPTALARLQEAASDPNGQIADTAMRAIADWPNADAWELLWLTYTGSNPQASQRALALRALVRLAGEHNSPPSPEWIARYRQLLDHAQQDSDRRLILGALSGMAHPEALELAAAQLANAEIRPEAVLAVKRIATALQEQHLDIAREALRRVELSQ